jgi:hypothetical protein
VDNTDYLLTNSHKERNSLLTTYKEICVCNPKSHSYCTEGSASDLNAGLLGPFVMFNKIGANLKHCLDVNLVTNTSLLKRNVTDRQMR